MNRAGKESPGLGRGKEVKGYLNPHSLDAVPPLIICICGSTRFRTEIAEVLSPTNPLGIKAGGEGGTTAAPAVVISAIVDALAGYGVRDIKMPATPYNIWRAIQDAKARMAANPGRT